MSNRTDIVELLHRKAWKDTVVSFLDKRGNNLRRGGIARYGRISHLIWSPDERFQRVYVKYTNGRGNQGVTNLSFDEVFLGTMAFTTPPTTQKMREIKHAIHVQKHIDVLMVLGRVCGRDGGLFRHIISFII